MPRRALALVASIGLLLAVALPATARNINAENLYSVHNLRSNVPGVAANTDPSLVNGWGIVAQRRLAVVGLRRRHRHSTLYNVQHGTGSRSGLTVTVAGRPDRPGLQRLDADFKVDAGTGPARRSRFIFATDDGQIAGWNGVGHDGDQRGDDARTRSISAWRSAAAAARTTCTPPTSTPARSTSSTARWRRIQHLSPATSPTRASRPATPRSASRPSAARSTSPMPSRTPTSRRGARRRRLRLRRRLRHGRHVPRPRRVGRRAQRAVGHGHGAGELRQVQRRPARRQLRRRPDPCLPPDRETAGSSTA